MSQFNRGLWDFQEWTHKTNKPKKSIRETNFSSSLWTFHRILQFPSGATQGIQ